ncbi:MAG: hypothetical protein MRECE_2c048 [Mycoplasmataceae bacterium CE_OT135]|nr:MAG: hypothetical protein MRECE_2c048 [Mycoplasmataceae bacterium CE_OT135]
MGRTIGLKLQPTWLAERNQSSKYENQNKSKKRAVCRARTSTAKKN